MGSCKEEQTELLENLFSDRMVVGVLWTEAPPGSQAALAPAWLRLEVGLLEAIKDRCRPRGAPSSLPAESCPRGGTRREPGCRNWPCWCLNPGHLASRRWEINVCTQTAGSVVFSCGCGGLMVQWLGDLTPLRPPSEGRQARLEHTPRPCAGTASVSVGLPRSVLAWG